MKVASKLAQAPETATFTCVFALKPAGREQARERTGAIPPGNTARAAEAGRAIAGAIG